MPDWLRLAVGTLTAIPVPPPRRVDRAVARDAMVAAPLVGLLLGAVAAVVLTVVRVVAPDVRSIQAVDMLAAVLALATLALLTRALHLDGLADTADGLGVKATGADAVQRRLEVMRAPDVGAFGVVAVVLILLVQLAALTVCSVSGYGTVSLVTAVVTGRLAATWSCSARVRAARADGLGAVVAGSVPTAVAGIVTLAGLGVVTALGLFDDDGAMRIGLSLGASMLVGLVVAAIVLRTAVRRFDGVTGDVMGAVVELATSAALVTAALTV